MLAFFCTGCTLAQSVLDVLHIRMSAIECFQDYIQKVSALDYPTKDRKYEFQKLFNDDAIIYNDFLPEIATLYLSPEAYVQKRNKDFSLNHHFTNLGLGIPYQEDGLWKIELSYIENIAVKNLKTKIEYPKCTFHCSMIISMEKNKNYNESLGESFSNVTDITNRMAFIEPKICYIQVNDPINQFLLIRKTESFSSISCDFTKIPNMEENPYFIMVDADTNTLATCAEGSKTFFSEQKFVPIKEDQKIYEYRDFKKNLFGIGITYAPYGFGNKLNKSLLPDFQLWSQSFGLDLFYGLNLVSKRRSSLFFNIKLGLNVYQNRFKGDWNIQYSSTDSDGETYLRNIHIKNTVEREHHLSAALQPSFEYVGQIYSKQQQKIFLSFEMGGYVGYRFGASNSFHFNATYSGIYDYFGGIELTHYYDYGSFTLNNKNISQNIKNKLNRFDYGAYGSIGVWYAFNSQHLIKINVGYMHGFTTPFRSVENHLLSSDFHSYESAVHSMVNGTQNLYLNISYITTISM